MVTLFCEQVLSERDLRPLLSLADSCPIFLPMLANFSPKSCQMQPRKRRISLTKSRLENLHFQTWLFAMFSTLFCALLRSFADLRLHSSVLICALVHVSAFRLHLERLRWGVSDLTRFGSDAQLRIEPKSGPWDPKLTACAEMIAELMLERADPVTFETFLLELIAFQLMPLSCPARRGKREKLLKTTINSGQGLSRNKISNFSEIAKRPEMITQIIRKQFFCVTDVCVIG